MVMAYVCDLQWNVRKANRHGRALKLKPGNRTTRPPGTGVVVKLHEPS